MNRAGCYSRLMTSRDMLLSEKLLEQEEERQLQNPCVRAARVSFYCRKVCATGYHSLELRDNQAAVGVLQVQYAVCGTDKQKSACLPAVGRQISAVSEATCSDR